MGTARSVAEMLANQSSCARRGAASAVRGRLRGDRAGACVRVCWACAGRVQGVCRACAGACFYGRIRAWACLRVGDRVRRSVDEPVVVPAVEEHEPRHCSARRVEVHEEVARRGRDRPVGTERAPGQPQDVVVYHVPRHTWDDVLVVAQGKGLYDSFQ